MSMDEKEIRNTVREYLMANFMFGESRGGLKDNDSFLETGIVDSTGVLMVVEFIQEKFGIKVGDDEMLPDNLDSVDNLVGYIKRKKA